MAFPATIRTTQASGFVGDLAVNGTPNAQTFTLNTTDPANNVVGRAFTHTATDGLVTAGGEGVFAGILANRAEYASYGTTAGGPLAPSITLPNGAIGDLITGHPGFFVLISNGWSIGSKVSYDPDDGRLYAFAPDGTPVIGRIAIPGARMEYSGNGLGNSIGIMSLTAIPGDQPTA
jgi:hypothetical protein